MPKTLFAICLFFSGFLHGQDLTTTQNTLLSYSYTSSYELINRLDKYEPTTKREKENYQEAKEYYEGTIADFALNTLYQELVAQDIQLEPKDALLDYVMYSDQGYPLVLIPKSAIKKLGKKGHKTDHYFVVNFSIGLSLAGGLLPGSVKPEVKCNIKVYNQKREQLKKIEGRNDGKIPIKMKEFPHNKFDKLEVEYMELLIEKLEPMVKDAISKAVEKL